MYYISPPSLKSAQAVQQRLVLNNKENNYKKETKQELSSPKQ